MISAVFSSRHRLLPMCTMGQAATGLGLIHQIQRSIRPPIGNWSGHWPLPVPASGDDRSTLSINSAQKQARPYAELGMNGTVKAYQILVSRLGYGGEQDANIVSTRPRILIVGLRRMPRMSLSASAVIADRE